MRRTLTTLLLVLLGLVAPLGAQRPLVGTTLTLTDTSADALHVGCAIGSSSCTGGVKAGTLAVASNATVGGTLGVTGATTLTSTLGVGGVATLASAAITSGATIGGTLGVTGAITGSSTITALSSLVSSISSGGAVELIQSGATTDEKNTYLRLVSSSARLTFCNDASSSCNDALTVTRSGATPILSTWSTAMAYTGVITPAALAAGNNNNYAPTGFAAAYRLRLTSGAASVLTGIAGGTDGREIVICTTNSTSIGLSNEDGNSTAANRIVVNAASSVFPCARLIYDGPLARWLVQGDLK